MINLQTIQEIRAAIPKEPKRFIKFLIVGVFGFVVDFGSFNLFHAVGVGLWVSKNLIPTAYLIEHHEIIEQTLSFCCAVTSNFLWNYFWIYPEAQSEPFAKKLGQFVLVSVLGLVIGVPVFTVALTAIKPVVESLGLSNSPINVAGNFALVCRVLVLLFWNFFVNRYWTYRHVK